MFYKENYATTRDLETKQIIFHDIFRRNRLTTSVSTFIYRLSYLQTFFSTFHLQIFNGKGVDRAGVPNILILFTDGLAHDFQLARTVSKELKRKGTRIVAIGAGRKAGEVFRQIKELASSKQDAHKSNFNELSGIVDDLLDVVCS